MTRVKVESKVLANGHITEKVFYWSFGGYRVEEVNGVWYKKDYPPHIQSDGYTATPRVTLS